MAEEFFRIVKGYIGEVEEEVNQLLATGEWVVIGTSADRAEYHSQVFLLHISCLDPVERVRKKIDSVVRASCMTQSIG